MLSTSLANTNSLHLTRHIWPREGHQLFHRALTIFWCVYSRFSIFCLNVSCFFSNYSLNSAWCAMFTTIQKEENVLRLFVSWKKILQGVCRRFHEANIVGVPCKRAQHCCATLRRSQNNRNVGLVGPKVWPVSNCTQQVPTSANKCQQVPTLLWFHANGRNTSQHCWAQQCWLLLANNVASVCMGL